MAEDSRVLRRPLLQTHREAAAGCAPGTEQEKLWGGRTEVRSLGSAAQPERRAEGQVVGHTAPGRKSLFSTLCLAAFRLQYNRLIELRGYKLSL